MKYASFSFPFEKRKLILQILATFIYVFSLCNNPANIYLFKVNNEIIKAMCETCSKSTIKTLDQRQWNCSGAFVVNFDHISRFFLVFLLLRLSMYLFAGKDDNILLLPNLRCFFEAKIRYGFWKAIINWFVPKFWSELTL